MSKQTAVEWLASHLNVDPFISTYVNPEMINRALEIEKQQIKDAWNNGVLAETFEMQFEQYYDHIYKSKKL